jgi:hypothetical protein
VRGVLVKGQTLSNRYAGIISRLIFAGYGDIRVARLAVFAVKQHKLRGAAAQSAADSIVYKVIACSFGENNKESTRNAT